MLPLFANALARSLLHEADAPLQRLCGIDAYALGFTNHASDFTVVHLIVDGGGQVITATFSKQYTRQVNTQINPSNRICAAGSGTLASSKLYEK